MRGRLAGIEMISYLTGPLIGNAQAGFTAEVSGLSVAIWSGGAVCVVAVVVTGFCCPGFAGIWGVRAQLGDWYRTHCWPWSTQANSLFGQQRSDTAR